MSVSTEHYIKKLRSIDRDEYEQSALNLFDGWIKRLEELEGMRALYEHFAIQDMIKEFNDDIKRIDETLLNQVGLEKVDRDVLLKEKMMYTKIVQRFDVSQSIESLASTIDESL